MCGGMQSSCLSLVMLDTTELVRCVVRLREHPDAAISSLAWGLSVRWQRMAARASELVDEALQYHKSQQTCEPAQDGDAA